MSKCIHRNVQRPIQKISQLFEEPEKSIAEIIAKNNEETKKGLEKLSVDIITNSSKVKEL